MCVYICMYVGVNCIKVSLSCELSTRVHYCPHYRLLVFVVFSFSSADKLALYCWSVPLGIQGRYTYIYIDGRQR